MAQTIIVPWHLASLSCYSKSVILVYFMLGQPSRFIFLKNSISKCEDTGEPLPQALGGHPPSPQVARGLAAHLRPGTLSPPGSQRSGSLKAKSAKLRWQNDSSCHSRSRRRKYN